MAEELSGKAKGGKARAASLSPEERRGIAQKAALARWNTESDIPKAKYDGVLRIGDIEIPCAVLDDGTRVITQRGIYGAIGRSGSTGGLGKKEGAQVVPRFLAPSNLKPFINKDLECALTPLIFKPKGSGRAAYGFKAETLPEICNVYLDARAAGILKPNQQKFAARCELLLRGFARIGIIALVDEATGYQDVRDRQALQAILDKFLLKEFAAWARKFPDEFYKEIFRLRNWEWKGMKVNPPQIVAHYTNDIVYNRLAPGLLEELQKKNPKNDKGNRKVKHHQFLTEDVGHPALAQHLYAVIGLMRIADNGKWGQFKTMLDKAYPKYTNLKGLPLFNASYLPNET